MPRLPMILAKKFDEARHSVILELDEKIESLKEEIALRENELKGKCDEIKHRDEEYKKKEYDIKSAISNKVTTLNTLYSKIAQIQDELNQMRQNKFKLEEEIKEIEDKYNDVKDYGPEIPGAYGLYEPKYNLCNSTQYKEWLKEIRDKQRNLVSTKNAIQSTTEWTLNNSKREGNKLISRVIKLALRAFNGECDAIMASTKYYSKYDARRDRIQKSYENINSMIAILEMQISDDYLFQKFEELDLVYGYEREQKTEREELARQREIQRDEEIARREYDREIKRIEKEQNHYQNELTKMKGELLKSAEKERAKYEKKIQELLGKINELQEKKEDFKRMFENKAGYVYIISNIGSFGEGIFKIGTTRRLDPYERIDELSNASVPFRYEPHALLFCENCYELERKMHEDFKSYRINKINNYKEFFRIPIDEIANYILSIDPTVQFIKTPEAIEFKLSMEKTNLVKLGY